jgi:hypothetical protein
MEAQDHSTVLGLAAPELTDQQPLDLVALLDATAAHAVVTSTSAPVPDEANVQGPAPTRLQSLESKQPTGDDKRFATLRAHLALKGYSLHRTAANDGPVCFYVTHWGMARELTDAAAVRTFAEQVGATHA